MNLRELLRYALLGGTFLVPFIPFVVADSMFFPFITGKNFLFRILVELLLAGWVLLALLDVRYRPRFSWILAAAAGFVAAIFFADLFAENVFKAFWSNFERMEGWVTLAHLFGYFLVFSTVLNTERLWARLAATSVGASVIMSFYGLAQLAGSIDISQGSDRLDGTFGNATYLAVYMLVHIFITILLLIKWRVPNWGKLALGLALLLQLFMLLQTETRGAILGLVGGLVVTGALLALTAREYPVVRKVGVGAAIALLALSGGVFVFKDTTFIQSIPGVSRVANISLDETTVRSRFMVWNMARQGFEERPVLGWGQEGFNYVFNEYYDPRMYDQEPWFDRAHNVFLDWLIAGGAVGLALYLAMPLAFLFYIWFGRRRDGGALFSWTERSVFTGMLAAYMFHNIFVFDNIGSYLFFFALLAYGHWRATPPAPEASLMRREVHESSVKTFVAPAVLVITGLVVYAINVPAISSAQTLLSAISPQQSGLERNVEFFEEALEYDTIGRQEVREQLVQFALELRRIENVPVGVEQRAFELAYDGMQQALERAPNDARLQVFMGSFLNNYGHPVEARKFLERAQELSPTKQAMHFAIGATYLRENKFVEALEAYRQAFELAPDFDEARIRYAVAALYAGQEVTSRELLEERFGSVIVDNDNLLQGYVDTGYDERALAIWQLRAEKKPTDPQTRLSLAAAYLRAGDREQAIAEIRRVIELNEQFRSRGESLIEDIRAGRL